MEKIMFFLTFYLTMFISQAQELPVIIQGRELERSERDIQRLNDLQKLEFRQQSRDVQRMIDEINRTYSSINTRQSRSENSELDRGLEQLRQSLNPDKPTLRALASPVDLSSSGSSSVSSSSGSYYSAPSVSSGGGTSSPSVSSETNPYYSSANDSKVEYNKRNFARFANSPCFQTLGFNANDPGLEERYRRCEQSLLNDRITKYSLWSLVGVGVIAFAVFTYRYASANKAVS